ncbi:MAG: bifunctional 2-polyprenyl-6-hydroxyphenol methylase/3-demethylubiquinol 3-O-methyltransferase UbiG [Alphaproteobacteria bacterium]|nr:bifunctional 2-polyprenyl-6-hydroxyphenol methylase/3-demethylubiquinol 3-O-methyltransferase UbiG [Alphaproteobacteria bacterium]
MAALDKTARKPLDRTIDSAEVERFARMAAEWWDPDGKFRPLHRLNPVRVAYIREQLCARFGRDVRADRPLRGLGVVDIGCGGGLIAEPLARLGAGVTGIDASERNIEVARTHAAGQGLAIDYRFAAAADLVAAGERFDAVLSLEVVEHVSDRRGFLGNCCALVKPGGALFLATLNRTAKSYLLGIVAAEYVLRWLPAGTHDWNRFVRPSELAADLREAGFRLADLKGITYNPLSDRFALSQDVDVNYLALAVGP